MVCTKLAVTSLKVTIEAPVDFAWHQRRTGNENYSMSTT